MFDRVKSLQYYYYYFRRSSGCTVVVVDKRRRGMTCHHCYGKYNSLTNFILLDIVLFQHAFNTIDFIERWNISLTIANSKIFHRRNILTKSTFSQSPRKDVKGKKCKRRILIFLWKKGRKGFKLTSRIFS